MARELRTSFSKVCSSPPLPERFLRLAFHSLRGLCLQPLPRLTPKSLSSFALTRWSGCQREAGCCSVSRVDVFTPEKAG